MHKHFLQNYRRTNFFANSFKMKRTIIVLLISTLIFFSPISSAFSNTPKKENVKTIVDHLKKFSYERWPVIFNGAVVGGKLCGVWCIVVGGGLAGAIDGVANYFGYSSKNYLTRGMWALVIGNKINLGKIKAYDPAKIKNMDIVVGFDELIFDLIRLYGVPAAGFVVGVLLPTGALEKIPSSLVAPVISIVAGNSKLAKITGIIDELSIAKSYTDNHYATFLVLGKNAANLWGDNLLVGYTGGVLGIVFAYIYEKEFIERFKSAAKTHKKAYEVFSQPLPKEYLDLQAENHDLFSMGDMLLRQIIIVNLLRHFQGVKHDFEHKKWDGLNKELRMMAISLVLLTGDIFISMLGNNYFNEGLQFAFNNQVHPKLVSSNVVNYPNSTVLTDSTSSDIWILVPSISGLRGSAIKSLLDGAYGFGMIIETGSLSILIYAFLYSQIDAYLTEKIGSKKKEYAKEIERLESERSSVVKHDTKNIRTIMERDGLKNTEEVLQKIGYELRKNVQYQNIYGAIESSYGNLFHWLDYIASFGLVANEIRKEDSFFASRSNLQQSSWQVLTFFSWFKNSAETVLKIELPLSNTATLVGLIYKPIEDNDKISRMTHDGNELMLENLEVGYGKKMLVRIDKLNLEIGKIYAITGETGCGKSSLLTKIKGIKEKNGAFGKGIIYYPKINGKYPKITMISQRDYFSLGSSLEESIYYPDKVPADKQRVESILKELNIRGFNGDDLECDDREEKLTLSAKKDWDAELSGGEKKKISIASAIVKKPDILILDEIFSAFDPETIPVVQKIIKKYLPNSLILIVDHHAQDNNYEAFYDGGELHFQNKSINLVPLQII